MSKAKKEWGKRFIVANKSGLRLVGRYVKETDCNTFSYSDQKCIAVGYDSKPNSDWGNYTKYGTVIVTKPELFEPTLDAIGRALGFKGEGK